MAFWLGTVKVPPYSNGTCSSLNNSLYDPKTFITHAALLRQTFVHCRKIPLLPPVGVWAVSQSQCGRSPSGRLRIVVVSRYLTNQLMRRGSICKW